jgi:hypothetical protein
MCVRVTATSAERHTLSRRRTLITPGLCYDNLILDSHVDLGLSSNFPFSSFIYTAGRGLRPTHFRDCTSCPLALFSTASLLAGLGPGRGGEVPSASRGRTLRN